ncbi:MAG TPA: HD domain-containing phosphohydrolase [Sulfuricurvum sp.]|nr:HD domain-containing phosphohydrolase [Sulfuricurvum sp.]
MSFRLKTILLFLVLSLVPYALTMVFLGSSFRAEQYEAVTREMNTQLNLTVQRIDQHFATLKNDMQFMAKSDVMNDLYTRDLDKRIGTLLSTKKYDMKMIGDFYVVDQQNSIVASSDFTSISKDFTPIFKKQEKETFLSVPIISNLTQQQIGKLMLTYPVENFKPFFSNSPERHYYLIHNDGSTHLRPSVFTESLKVTQKLGNKPDTIIILEEKKEFAYQLLYKYEKWFMIMLFAGAVVIASAAYYIATLLIRPVISLSEVAKKITRTQDYTQKVTVDRDDEIGQLSDAFNTMISGMDQALEEIIALNEEIEDTQREVVFTMGSIGESRSRETGNHVRRVAEYTKLLAMYYGLNEEEAEMLKQASPMHDIGKVAIPDAVLNKPGRFNEEERKIMNTHTSLGLEMLQNSRRPLLVMAATVAYEHHEKWDGSGYPRGLSGEEIHIYGRITALADVFDALGSDRVYKKAWDDTQIFAFFKEERGKHFDPKLVDIFFDHLDEFLVIRDRLKDVFKAS